MLVIFIGSMLLPIAASAYDIPATIPKTILNDNVNGIDTKIVCPGTDPANPIKGLTSRLIPCIRDAVIFATTDLTKAFYQHFNDTIKFIFILAITFWGILVMTGHSQNISRDGIILGIKIGAVILFSDNFNNLYPKLLDSVEGLLNILATPAIPLLNENGTWNGIGGFVCEFGTFQDSERNIMEVWNILDCYIDLLVGGIFSSFTLGSGIIGFITAAVFSTSVGLFVAMAGLYMLAVGFMTIAKVVYIFVTSYIAFSFMVIISCIFIPCILFRHTKEYFDNWLRLTLSFMLQPLFVFGYLIMFIVAINVTIFAGKNSLYYAIAGEATTVPTNGAPFAIGTWLNANGIFKEKLKTNDQIRTDSDGQALNEQQPVQTGQTDKQGFNPLAYKDLSDFMTFNPNDLTKPLAFYQAGIPVVTVDWQRLAEIAWKTEWEETQATINAVVDDKNGLLKQEIIDQFNRDYQVSVFIAFLMAAITMYIFYSLLEYMPFIGTATLGDTGISPTFGAGALGPPGSSFFGGGR